MRVAKVPVYQADRIGKRLASKCTLKASKEFEILCICGFPIAIVIAIAIASDDHL